MPLDPDLRAMLRQTITVASPLGNTDRGDIVYADPVTAPAKVDFSQRVMDTSKDGEELVTLITITTELAIGDRDLVWLPDADTSDPGAGRQPQSVTYMTDEDGSVSHFEVIV